MPSVTKFHVIFYDNDMQVLSTEYLYDCDLLGCFKYISDIMDKINDICTATNLCYIRAIKLYDNRDNALILECFGGAD